MRKTVLSGDFAVLNVTQGRILQKADIYVQTKAGKRRKTVYECSLTHEEGMTATVTAIDGVSEHLNPQAGMFV